MRFNKYNINSVNVCINSSKCWRLYRANTNFRQVYAGDKSNMLESGESWQIWTLSKFCWWAKFMNLADNNDGGFSKHE